MKARTITLRKIGTRELLICNAMFLLHSVMSVLDIPKHLTITSLIFILTFCYYWQDYRLRKIAVSFPLVVWLLLTIYHFVNGYVKHVPGVDYVDLIHGFKIYCCIVIFAFWSCVDFKSTVWILIKSYTYRCLFVLLYLSIGGLGNRLTGAGGSATGLGQFAAMGAVLLIFANALEYISYKKNVKYFFLFAIVVVLTVSRNSLAMLMFAIISVYVLHELKISQRARGRVILSILILGAVLFLVMLLLKDSSFVERARTTQDSFENSYNYDNYVTGTIFDKIVGDRLPYYVRGFDFFKQSPLTGIGMWNYKYLTGGIYPLHSEYMVHMCEGGIIAAVLWGTYEYYIINNMWKCNKSIEIKVAMFSALGILLFCAIYAREFFYEFFYPVYGLIIYVILDNNNAITYMNNEEIYAK